MGTLCHISKTAEGCSMRVLCCR